MEEDCSKLVKGQEKQGSTLNVAYIIDEDSNIALTGSSMTDQKDEWINYKKFFSSSSELEGVVVYMRNDAPCKIKGIGEVQLQMHNETVRYLAEVRYVPFIKKIISLES